MEKYFGWLLFLLFLYLPRRFSIILSIFMLLIFLSFKFYKNKPLKENIFIESRTNKYQKMPDQNQIKRDEKKRRKFYTYTSIYPCLALLLFSINLKYGVVCSDECRVHSYFVHYMVLISFWILGISNISLLTSSKSALTKPLACYWLVVLNCLLYFTLWLSSINGYFMMFAVIPWSFLAIPYLILFCYAIPKRRILNFLSSDIFLKENKSTEQKKSFSEEDIEKRRKDVEMMFNNHLISEENYKKMIQHLDNLS